MGKSNCQSGSCLLAGVLLLVMALCMIPNSAYADNASAREALPKDLQDEIETSHVNAMVALRLTGVTSSRDRVAHDRLRLELYSGYRPKTIDAYHDLKFDDPLTPFEEMSSLEKYLAWGYYDYISTSVADTITMPLLLANSAYRQYEKAKYTVPDMEWVEDRQYLDVSAMCQYLELRVSSVTNEIIKTDCASFSAGNAYVRIVGADEVTELIELDPIILEGVFTNKNAFWRVGAWGYMRNYPYNYDEVEPENPVWVKPPYLVYVRIYGEEGVLIEGLF